MNKGFSRKICTTIMAFVLVVGLCPLSNVQASAQPFSQSSSSQVAAQESSEGASTGSAEGATTGESLEAHTSNGLAASSPEDSNNNASAQSNPESLSSLPKSAKVDEREEGSAYASGEVLVTMKGSAESGTTTETLQQAQTVKTDVVTDENVVSQDTLVAEVADGATVAQAVAELEADPDVEAVQPNYYYTLMDDEAAEATAAEEIQQSIAELAPQSSVTTNDPLASSQWGIESAHVNEAWTLAECNGSVTVAVLDSGFDMTHEDLETRFVSPKDIMDGDTDPTMDAPFGTINYYHGTHVAGIIAAEADNGKGIVGYSFNANIMPVKVFSSSKETTTSTLIEAYDWVFAHASTDNVRVVNMSLGKASPFSDPAFEGAIDRAKEDYGILTVCAAGNTSLTSTPPPFGCWPAQYANCIGVANLQNIGGVVSRSSSSNYAFADGICAPGTAIKSTVPVSSYDSKSGTSMASPVVAGIAALCFAAKPSATVDEVRTCLENTATDCGPVGKDDEYGYGEVNAYAAVISMLGIDIQGADLVETGTTETYSLNNVNITDAVWSVSDTSKATINANTGVLTPVAAGAVTVTATSGSYSWSKDITVWPGGIKDISAADTSELSAQPYSGTAYSPTPEVTYYGIPLVEGTDYTLSYANNEHAGTATVTITGIGQFKGTKPISFAITPIDISGATVSSIPAEPYTGSTHAPTPAVTLDGKTLTEGTDYTFSYANNINPGTATVTIIGKGNYSGTKPISFTITPTDISAATVSSIPAVAYTGKAWTPSPTVSFGGSKLTNGSDYTLSYAKNINVGTATVTIAGKGNYGGSKTVNFRIVDILSYTTHVQNIGWQNYVGSGAMAGTSGRSLRLEGIKIKTDASSLGLSGGITYQTHVQNIGWQSEVSNNALSGTSGRSLRLEAIKIRLTGQLGLQYDVYYRVHAQDVGWMGWAKNGEAAGTAGYSKRLEGIQIVLVPKNSGAPAATYRGITSVDTHPCIDASATNGVASYSATMHIQRKGNTNFSTSGSQFLGTTGSALRVEALTITEFNAPSGSDLGLRYKTHIQNKGWETSWRSVGQRSGTSGQSLRLEALQIELTGADASSYDVYYRTHIQNIGWTGWAKNGQQCGSAGYAYRMEAMQIVVVPKNGTAPGINSGYFYKR